MVRLVFRPYTQLRRSICTSESLRTSIRVSPDFILARHSSPSFGYQRARYRCASDRRRPTAAPKDDRPHPRRTIETPRECGRPAAILDHGTSTRNAIFPVHFHYAFNVRVSQVTSAPCGTLETPRLARMLDSLVRVSRRVGKRPEEIVADRHRRRVRDTTPDTVAYCPSSARKTRLRRGTRRNAPATNSNAIPPSKDRRPTGRDV